MRFQDRLQKTPVVHVHRVHTGHKGDPHAQLGLQGAGPDVQDMPQVSELVALMSQEMEAMIDVQVLGRKVEDAAHLPQVQGGHAGQSQKADGVQQEQRLPA